uniref:procathepsin L-like n=1 Tax=Pristiophorus japonicus TaxID=55135 RepID=UPI00398F3431
CNYQGQCGSCWAFSANGALEGQWYKTKGQLVPLSEQNLVDCNRGNGNYGCRGGWMANAYRYVIKNKGINSEATYPYTGRDESCKFQSNDMLPLSVDVVPLQCMLTGVYYDPTCSKTVNHAVLVVGYGTESGKQYWIVKNSWGTGWGDQGYIKMAKDRNNQCGIASYAIFPVV